MSDIHRMRDVADQRLRPAKAGQAVAGGSGASIPAGRVRQLNRYDHVGGQTYRYGTYGRGRYGQHRYAG